VKREVRIRAYIVGARQAGGQSNGRDKDRWAVGEKVLARKDTKLKEDTGSTDGTKGHDQDVGKNGKTVERREELTQK